MDAIQQLGQEAMSDKSSPSKLDLPSTSQNLEDVDTCRICRGAGTTEEQLFYPCKCSGSIKYVHQNCLSEWLAHSQKKHCELCKTPFRFTKLYDAHMPSTVPMPIFLRQAMRHAWNSTKAASRLQMVIFVWAFWLPWCMRSVWRILFWLADGGWVNVETRNLADAAATLAAPNLDLASQMKARLWDSTKGFIISQVAEPLTLKLLKTTYRSIFHMKGAASPHNAKYVYERAPSWLSKYPIFQSPTRSNFVNNMILDTLEGQVITIVTVVGFILIFLIREWVMQQQQNIDLGIANADLPAVVPIEGEFERQRPGLREERVMARPRGRLRRRRPTGPEPLERDGVLARENHYHVRAELSAGSSIAASTQPTVTDSNLGHGSHDLAASTAIDYSLQDSYTVEPPYELAHNPAAEWNFTSLGEGLDNQISQVAPDYTHTRPSTPDSFYTLPTGSINELVDESELVRQEQGESTSDVPTGEGNVLIPSSPAEPLAVEGMSRKSRLENLFDYLWGRLEAQAEGEEGNDERVIGQLADEAPFIAVGREQVPHPIELNAPLAIPEAEPAVPNNQEGDAPIAAEEAGEDGNDFDGILDLLGLNGPWIGLFQNGFFCAVLISLTILIAIWLPLLIGKLVLLALDSPVEIFLQPLRFASICADVMVDCFIFAGGNIFYWLDNLFGIVSLPLVWLVPYWAPIIRNRSIRTAARTYSDSALVRLTKSCATNADFLGQLFDVPRVSILSRQSLRHLQLSLSQMGSPQTSLIIALRNVPHGLADCIRKMSHILPLRRTLQGSSSIFSLRSLRFHLSLPPRTPVDYATVAWTAEERVIGTTIGYLTLAVFAFLYLRTARATRGTDAKGRVEGVCAEILYQVGGVLKVVLIISIEMIAFPLYCGILLDIAMLPLFGNATLSSRFQFSLVSPNFSLFIHWFIGTCYMFNFALFVSMCRKLFRSGVLFFIRDPDDPTFHPVRDVLERSVVTQLWKISVSAMIYGALIICCLGGVVWGIDWAFVGIFPINWSSSEPLLGVPVDLLSFNFLMPLAAKMVKPASRIFKIYDWWFRKSARWLQLSSFLFGLDYEDERRKGLFDYGSAPGTEVGQWVQAPGSDQVRIPKGEPTFVPSDKNQRMDGLYTRVWQPLRFRARLVAFVFLLWLFSAGTGLSLTLLPLVIGRQLLNLVLWRRSSRLNDIYAYSSGAYLIGAVAYVVSRRYTIRSLLVDAVQQTQWRRLVRLTKKCVGLVYVYGALGVVMPILFALTMQCYFVIPTHTYLLLRWSAEQEGEIDSDQQAGQSTGSLRIRLAQDWTLGILYTRLLVRLILWHTPSRPAAALRRVVQQGWLKVDVGLATRGFIVPGISLMGVILLGPLGLGWIANAMVDADIGIFGKLPALLGLGHEQLHLLPAGVEWADFVRMVVYRYAYTVVCATTLSCLMFGFIFGAVRRWRGKIRDEVYLVGERLHNYAGHARSRIGVGATAKRPKH